MAKKSDIETPTAEDLVRLDRQHKDDSVDIVADNGYLPRDMLQGFGQRTVAQPDCRTQSARSQRLELSFSKRSSEFTFDRCNGMRRVWLRGRVDVQECYLLQVAGLNLGLLM